MARERGVVPDRFNRCTDRAARFVSENHDERRAQDLHCILEAGDPVVGSEVARYAYDEKITAAGVERVLWRDARIGATQDSGKRVLSHRQGFALGFEVVPSCNPFHVALVACHQALERVTSGETTFSGFGGGLASSANARPATAKPTAAPAASFSKPRRGTTGSSTCRASPHSWHMGIRNFFKRPFSSRGTVLPGS